LRNSGLCRLHAGSAQITSRGTGRSEYLDVG